MPKLKNVMDKVSSYLNKITWVCIAVQENTSELIQNVILQALAR